MAWPTQNSIVNKVKKIGLTIQGPNRNGQYWIEANGRIASWYLQDGKATSFHCHRVDDISDSMTDYSAGYFVHTIKAMIRSLELSATGREVIAKAEGK